MVLLMEHNIRNSMKTKKKLEKGENCSSHLTHLEFDFVINSHFLFLGASPNEILGYVTLEPDTMCFHLKRKSNKKQ